MSLTTNKLLLISIGFIALAFVIVPFSETLGIRHNQMALSALALNVAFGLNTAGIAASFYERKEGKKKSSIGLIGNTILVIGYFIITILALNVGRQ
ncbi:hypothetical protein [Reichenbachiella sp.]